LREFIKSTNPASRKNKGYTIGLTIYVNRDGKLGLFENGLRQNVFFLYKMFRASPNCKQVYLLNHGDGEPLDAAAEAKIDPAAIVRTAQVLNELDYVISVGAAIDKSCVEQLKSRDIPIIAYKCGNGGVISMEATAARPPRADAERYTDADDFTAIWMTPQHLHTYRGWCETIYRRPVDPVPHIWAPDFIENRPDEISRNFGYKVGNRPWRIAVMDPNITVMKTSHMPILVCEAAFREAPNDFAAFYITNTIPHLQNGHFSNFLNWMSATKAGIMTPEARFVSADMLTNHSDAVVTHQWENELNYLYYEVLYGGYPLIHNSKMLEDYGYYYPSFDPIEGGKTLVEARRVHDKNLHSYREKVDVLMKKLDPISAINIEFHEKLLIKMKSFF